MKIRFLILILVFLHFSALIFAQQLSFDFYDSGGNKYNSLTFNAQLEKKFKVRFNGKLILLLTAKESDLNYQRQNIILKSLDSENLQLLYVNGCKAEELKDGYYITKKAAVEIMGDSNKFLLYIIDSKGMVRCKSNEILSQRKLRSLVKHLKKIEALAISS